MSRETLERAAILTFFGAAVCWSLYVASIGWSHALSDSYGWRQTQTALSAYFIQQGGPWLDYETPLLGPPWSVPHEFPLYQWAVVALARWSGLGLEASGRAVSLAFFYLTLVLAFLLLAELGVPAVRRLIILGLWLVSPLYLFWSRTFMLESTALCLSVAYLTFIARFLTRRRAWEALVAFLAGALAFAVKPPTVVTFAALAGLWWVVSLFRAGGRRTAGLWAGPLLVVLPLLAGWLWHWHKDAVLRLHPLGIGWSSAAMWRDWVVGTPGLRRQPELWLMLWNRTIPEALGHWSVIVAGLSAVLVAARRRSLVVVALLAFVGHVTAFPMVHVSHNYYAYAISLFLVFAVGLAVVALLECCDWRHHLAWPLLVAAVLAGVSGYRTRMLPMQRQDAYRKPAWMVRLGNALANHTRPTEVIVGFGLAWNPEVAYYSKRRALMWPGWADIAPRSADVAKALAGLRRYPVGALFTCTDEVPPETLALFQATLRLTDSPVFEIPAVTATEGGHGRCRVYLRADGQPPHL